MVQTTKTEAIPADYTKWMGSDCPNRLPCGLCMILNRDCPKMTISWEPPWTINHVTCNATGE